MPLLTDVAAVIGAGLASGITSAICLTGDDVRVFLRWPHEDQAWEDQDVQIIYQDGQLGDPFDSGTIAVDHIFAISLASRDHNEADGVAAINRWWRTIRDHFRHNPAGSHVSPLAGLSYPSDAAFFNVAFGSLSRGEIRHGRGSAINFAGEATITVTTQEAR